jgi:hypothetical protein
VPHLDYNVVSLPNGRDWIMRPVLSRHIKFSELFDGTYDLCQIAELNEALEADAENQFRAHEAMNKRDGRL